MSLTAVAILNLALAAVVIGALSAVVAWPLVWRRGVAAQVGERNERPELRQAA